MKEEDVEAYAGCLKAVFLGLIVCIIALFIGLFFESLLISLTNLW